MATARVLGAEPVPPARSAHARLASALARYADPCPPTLTEVRTAVAEFAAEYRRATGGRDGLRTALDRCVRLHAPPSLAPADRAALVELLVRWGSG